MSGLNVLCPETSVARVCLKFHVFSVDPRFYPTFCGGGGAVGAVATHFDGIFGCGEPDILSKERGCLGQRSGDVGAQEKSFDHVGTELTQAGDFSAQFTHGDFPKAPRRMPAFPELWAARRRPSSFDEIKAR